LAFDEELHHWEFPKQFQLIPSGEPLSIAEALEVYATATPRLQVNHMGIPRKPEHAYSAYVVEIHEDGPNKNMRALVNPYTGELTRVLGKDSISGWIVDLHRHLAAGKTGQMIIAVSSLLLAITSIFGLLLWWPMRGRTFVRAWKRGRALDWHNALGLIALLPLIIMAITGITFTWGKHIFPILEGVQGSSARAVSPQFDVPIGTPKVPLADVVRYLKAAYPDAALTGVQPSNHRPNPHKFIFEEGFQVFMNPYTGKVDSSFDGRGTGGLVGAYQRNFGMIHTMGPFNLFLRLLWGFLSLAGAVLTMTGLWMSIRRWQKRSQSKSTKV